MGYGAREAVARRQRAKFARIGYAIRQARRDRDSRLPVRLAGQMTSAGALGSSLLEPKRPADDLGGDVPVASPPTAPSLQAEAPAVPQRSKIPTAGGALPPSRRQLEELERRDAPALFDRLTQDGSRSAVAAVQRRAWRLEERKEQALGMARVLDGTARVDPTFRGRCFASWSILSPSPTSLPSSIVCFAAPARRATMFSLRSRSRVGGDGGGALVCLDIWDASTTRTSTEPVLQVERRRNGRTDGKYGMLRYSVRGRFLGDFRPSACPRHLPGASCSLYILSRTRHAAGASWSPEGGARGSVLMSADW